MGICYDFCSSNSSSASALKLGSPLAGVEARPSRSSFRALKAGGDFGEAGVKLLLRASANDGMLSAQAKSAAVLPLTSFRARLVAASDAR